MKNIEEKVNYFRNTVIEGKCINLVPYTPEHANSVIRLRNFPDVRHFLNQAQESSPASQNAWHAEYLKRNNDIFWITKDKQGRIVGCNRLYDITPETAEKGSLIADPEYTRAAPIALEGDLLIIRLAFSEFQVNAVTTTVRPDNSKVLSMNERFGFQPIGNSLINNVEYTSLALKAERFQPDRLDQLITYWSKRNELRET